MGVFVILGVGLCVCMCDCVVFDFLFLFLSVMFVLLHFMRNKLNIAHNRKASNVQEVGRGLLIAARVSGRAHKFPSDASGRSPAAKRILLHFRPKFAPL